MVREDNFGQGRMPLHHAYVSGEHVLEDGQRRFSEARVSALMNCSELPFEPRHHGDPDRLFAWKMAKHGRLGQSDPIRDGLHAHAIGSVLGHEVEDGFDNLLLASFSALPRFWL